MEKFHLYVKNDWDLGRALFNSLCSRNKAPVSLVNLHWSHYENIVIVRRVENESRLERKRGSDMEMSYGETDLLFQLSESARLGSAPGSILATVVVIGLKMTTNHNVILGS